MLLLPNHTPAIFNPRLPSIGSRLYSAIDDSDLGTVLQESFIHGKWNFVTDMGIRCFEDEFSPNPLPDVKIGLRYHPLSKHPF